MISFIIFTAIKTWFIVGRKTPPATGLVSAPSMNGTETGSGVKDAKKDSEAASPEGVKVAVSDVETSEKKDETPKQVGGAYCRDCPFVASLLMLQWHGGTTSLVMLFLPLKSFLLPFVWVFCLERLNCREIHSPPSYVDGMLEGRPGIRYIWKEIKRDQFGEGVAVWELFDELFCN